MCAIWYWDSSTNFDELIVSTVTMSKLTLTTERSILAGSWTIDTSLVVYLWMQKRTLTSPCSSWTQALASLLTAALQTLAGIHVERYWCNLLELLVKFTWTLTSFNFLRHAIWTISCLIYTTDLSVVLLWFIILSIYFLAQVISYLQFAEYKRWLWRSLHVPRKHPRCRLLNSIRLAPEGDRESACRWLANRSGTPSQRWS